MSESSDMLFVTMLAKADALGDLTTTNAVTATFAGAGIATGLAAATAVAQGTTAAAPYTDATTDGLADGGFITSSRTSHMSIDFPTGRRRSQYRSPSRSSQRTVSVIFCLTTHCLGWRVLPFMDFYDQKPISMIECRCRCILLN
jgi:hypothetical protein